MITKECKRRGGGRFSDSGAVEALGAGEVHNRYLKVSAWRDADMSSRKTRLDKAEKDWW